MKAELFSSPQAGFLLAVHRSALKLSWNPWVLAQRLPSADWDCQVQNPKRDHSTLCPLPEGEPSAVHLLLPCVHIKFRTRIQIYTNKLFRWLFFFSPQLCNEPNRVSEFCSLFAIYDYFYPHWWFFILLFIHSLFFLMNGHLKYLIVKPFVLNWQPHDLSAFIIPLWHLFSHLLNQIRNLNSPKMNLTKKTDGFLLAYFCELKYGGRGRAGGLPMVAGSCWVFSAVVWNKSLRAGQHCVSLVPSENAVWNKIMPMAENK